MRDFVKDFMFRGMVACGFGPIVLAIIYLILQKCGVVNTLSLNEVCIGIFSLAGLAFISGGMNALYQIERLPLLVAILIHGVVLYFAYLGTYLLNHWLELGWITFWSFTGIFVVGYLVIWVIIYLIIRKRAAKLNAILVQKQKSVGDVD